MMSIKCIIKGLPDSAFNCTVHFYVCIQNSEIKYFLVKERRIKTIFDDVKIRVFCCVLFCLIEKDKGTV